MGPLWKLAFQVSSIHVSSIKAVTKSSMGPFLFEYEHDYGLIENKHRPKEKGWNNKGNNFLDRHTETEPGFLTPVQGQTAPWVVTVLSP